MGQELNQLEIRFDPKEDRLQLALRMQDFSEYRVWITRRYVQMIWKILCDLVALRGTSPQELHSQMKQTHERFEQEQAARQNPAPAQYGMSLAKQPLGPDPILVTRLQVRRMDEETHILVMLSEEGHCYQLGVNDMLIQSLAKLVVAAVEKAEWGLGFKMEDLMPRGPQ